MLGWLRRILRRWLIEEPEPRPYLDCLIPDKAGPQLVTYFITGAQGLMLVGQPTGTRDRGERLIRAEDTHDQKHFHRLWKRFSVGVDLRWEDGTPVDLGHDK